MKKKRNIFLIIITVIGFILITFGVTYALFNYSRVGTTENTITAGAIKFHFDEINKKGNGITINDALPVDSNLAEKNTNNYFAFDITAKTATQPITYVVTAKKSDNSDNLDGIVDMYLTDNQNVPLFGGVHRYSNLIQYRNKATTEKVIYTGTVSANQSDYTQNFRLRMWIDQGVNFSGVATTKYYCNGTEVEYNSTAYNNCDSADLTESTDLEYQYNDKTFKITINVYTDSSITGYTPIAEAGNDATLSSLSLAGCTFSETFTPEVTSYTCSTYTGTYPPSYSDLSYTFTDSNAHLGSGVGDIPGVTFAIPVVSANGNNTKLYTITVPSE